jgi:DNA-binding transcriptional ArsR family regulator
MVKYNDAALDRVFAALADPTRRAILARLARGGETSVGELGAPFAISGPAVTKHLKVLEAAGLVRRTREGRVHRCRFDAAPIGDAATWIETYRRLWEAQLDHLAAYLEKTQPPTEEKPDGRRQDRRRRR